MIRKSIPSFVLALIAGPISAYVGFYIIWVSLLIGAFGGTDYIFFTIAGWACLLGSVLGIVGGSFCFKRAKVGAVILTIVTATAGVALVWAFFRIIVASGSASGEGNEIGQGIVMGILTLAPAIMYVIATIFAYLAKPTETYVAKPQQFAPQAPQTAQQTSVQSVDNQTTNDIKKE